MFCLACSSRHYFFEVCVREKNVRVFGAVIPHSVRAAETSAEGVSIFKHDPKGKVAAAYKKLAKEVLADE